MYVTARIARATGQICTTKNLNFRDSFNKHPSKRFFIFASVNDVRKLAIMQPRIPINQKSDMRIGFALADV